MKTVTLETAKALKEAGFKEECHFGYVDGELECNPSPSEWPLYAPTTDELLEQLPDLITQDGIATVLVIGKPNNIFKVGYRPFSRQVIEFENKSLPEALSLCWLYLKQQNLIK